MMNKMSPLTLARLLAYLLHNAVTKPGFSAYKPNNYQAFYRNPLPVYDRILREQPVFFAPSMASWIVSRYDDVSAGLRDPRLDPNFRLWRFAPASQGNSDWDKVINGLLFTLDKASHSRIRRLTAPAFGPRTISRIEQACAGIVERCLDDITPGGTINFAAQVAQQIPREVVAALVGVKKADHPRFAALTESVMLLFDPSQNADTRHAQQGVDLMREYIAERRNNPSDDFLSQLINHVEDGDRISEWEAIGLVASLIAAGPDTSSDDLNFAIYNMLLNPGVKEQLLADPSLIDNFILEHTRHNHFGYAAPIRFALEDVEIGGHTIRKGEMIRFLIPAANRDPQVFDRPEQFDLQRDNLNKVLRYGVGAHFCVGSAIAQTIARTTLQAWLQRFPQMQLAAEPVYEKHLTSRRMQSLMLQL